MFFCDVSQADSLGGVKEEHKGDQIGVVQGLAAFPAWHAARLKETTCNLCQAGSGLVLKNG